MTPPSTPPSISLRLAPLFEEVAQRYGFHGGQGGPAEYRIPSAALEGLRIYGRALEPADVVRYCRQQGLEVEEEGGSLLFPAEAAGPEEWRRARGAFRALLRWLSEENPHRLGRLPPYRWDRPRTPVGPLHTSREWLQRAYADGFVAPEKKELVADLRACQGMYLASVDRDERGPRCALLDSSSQISSALTGFNQPSLRGMLAYPEAFLNPDYRRVELHPVEAFRRVLRRMSPPELKYVSFTNSGAEAVEKALALAALKFPERGRRIVAFKGGFHGRTLLALSCSWNPEKREPFRMEGFEAHFVDFPDHPDPDTRHPIPPGWIPFWEKAADPDFSPEELKRGNGALLERELEALCQVRRRLLTGEVFAVVVEPFQGEGGDRYATPRFFQALRALTRACGVALVLDEVQAGMGLGGTFFWHQTFDLPYPPDFVCLAKKAQLGVVLSTIPDPAPTSAHVASVLRGYLMSQLVNPEAIRRVEEQVRPRLRALAERHAMMENPRCRGLAFAFDVPDEESAQALVDQRFDRGYLVYKAGTRTLRYRLHVSVSPRELDLIFAALEQSLALLERYGPRRIPSEASHPWDTPVPSCHPAPRDLDDLEGTDWNAVLRVYGQLEEEAFQALHSRCGEDPVAWYRRCRPAWAAGSQEAGPPVSWLHFVRYLATLRGTRIHRLTPELWGRYKDQIMALEKRIYEPARRDSEEFLAEIVSHPRSVCLVAVEAERVVGFALAGPLEGVPGVRGPHEDPERGRGTCLYSADIAVAPEFRGRGLGVRLKRGQIEWARRLGYRWIRSRNRVDRADRMMEINRSLGACEIFYYPRDYREDRAPCLYSSTPVEGRLELPVHWSRGVEEPTGGRLAAEDWEDWDLAAMHKLSLANWATPNYVRYVEWLREIRPPGLDHLYLASGRDEAADKAVKTLKFHRRKATMCASFHGAYWGHTTAAARSLSDPAIPGYYPWIHLPYPAVEGDPLEDGPLTREEARVLEELRRQIREPAYWLGVFVEPVQEKTGRRVSARFLRALRELCDELDVPLVFNESASWAYRGAPCRFFTEALGFAPEVLVFYAGGQLGHTLVNRRYFIPTPLAMISTWEGDELSFLRLREQMRTVEAALDETRLARADEALRAAGAHTWRGTGWVELPGRKPQRLDPSLEGSDRYLVVPPLTCLMTDLDDLLEQLR